MRITQHPLNFLRLTIIAAAFAVSLLAVAAASAQSPPAPPSRFVGNVTVNGVQATAGTTIEARIGTTTCGTASVFMSGSEARYVLDSPALDPATAPNCGSEGSAVTFYVAGQKANETGNWKNYELNTVNLTVAPAAAASPTATPGAPVAGNTAGGSDAPATWYLVAGALGVLGFAGAGFAVAGRRT